jgi:hypothetical protein
LWDGGIDVKLGDALNGYDAKSKVSTFAEAAAWLRDQACTHYPDSEFASKIWRVRLIYVGPNLMPEGQGQGHRERGPAECCHQHCAPQFLPGRQSGELGFQEIELIGDGVQVAAGLVSLSQRSLALVCHAHVLAEDGCSMV